MAFRNYLGNCDKEFKVYKMGMKLTSRCSKVDDKL